MSKLEVSTIIEGVVKALEPRFERIEHQLGFMDEDIKALKSRMASMEETLDDVRAEQRLIRHAATNNLADIMRLKDRLELRPS